VSVVAFGILVPKIAVMLNRSYLMNPFPLFSDLKDDLHSPSSRLVIGRPTLVGSGLFETRLNPSLLTGMQNPNVTYGTSVLHRTSMGTGFGGHSSGLALSSTSSGMRGRNSLMNGSFLANSSLSPSMMAPSLLTTGK